jgi:hypothetical protein
MLRLLQSFPFKGLAQGLRAGAAKLPFRSDAAKLVPDEAPIESPAWPGVDQGPAELEARVLAILRAASKVPPGPQRSDALAEVNQLRQRAIELHRRTAANLRAQLADARSDATASQQPK